MLYRLSVSLLVSSMCLNIYYNIASRTAQSNSVYVSVLKIAIVLADGVSKSFFSREQSLSARGKISYFATIMDTIKPPPTSSKTKAIYRPFLMG